MMKWHRPFFAFALSLTLLLGAFAAAQARGAMAAGMQITICTPGGPETIRLHDPAPVFHGGAHCPDCTLGSVTLTAPLLVSWPALGAVAVAHAASDVGCAGRAPATPRARGPPSVI